VILVDTNVVSEMMRREPDPRVVEWLDAQAAETLHLSSVSMAELLLGIALLPDGRRKAELASALSVQAVALLGARLLPFDVSAAEAFAGIVSRTGRSGFAIGMADGQIATTAVVHGLIVATRDAAPFLAAGLVVVDPWQAGRA
jgi:predicted nucleic acid-binding protein